MIRAAALAAAATLVLWMAVDDGSAAGERSRHVVVVGAEHGYTFDRQTAATAASRSAARKPVIPRPVHIAKPVAPPPPEPDPPTPVAPSTSTSNSGGTTVAPSSDGLNWAAVANCESGGNPATNTGNGYYGLYQFSVSTWASVGGSGLPSDASADEQTMRAQILFERSGDEQWPVCGDLLYS